MSSVDVTSPDAKTTYGYSSGQRGLVDMDMDIISSQKWSRGHHLRSQFWIWNVISS